MVITYCAATAIAFGMLPINPNPMLALTLVLLVGTLANCAFGATLAYPSLVPRRKANGLDLSVVTFVANVGALVFPPLMGFILD